MDMQRIKMTELDEVNSNASSNTDDPDGSLRTAPAAPRIPRNLDIEVRGDLVNQCIPGDIIRVTGVVKTMQVILNVF